MTQLKKADFASWTASYDFSSKPCVLEVLGKWGPTARCNLEVSEDSQGGDMVRTLILHLQPKAGEAPTQVLFRRETEFEYYNVVAIRFPGGEFERIYLENYDPKDENPS